MDSAEHRVTAPALGRVACILMASAALLGNGHAAAQEQAYPAKTIRLIVAYPPGGSTDGPARILAQRLSQSLGVSVIVENKTGANGSIGTEYVARSAADGYTLLFNSISPMVVNPHTFAKGVPYDTLNDFMPITGVGANPSMLAINPELPAKNLKELIELGKTRDIALSSSGEGGLPHLVIESFKKASSARIIHVPYKGGGPAAADAVAGHVQGVVIDLSALRGLVQGGRLRGIFVAGERRSEFMPDVPTATEEGIPIVGLSWMGIFAPAKTPKPVIDRLFAAAAKVLEQPEVKEAFAKLGLSTFAFASPDAFARFVKEEYAKWGTVAKESGAKTKN